MEELEKLVSKFPPFLRVHQGDNLKLDFEDDILTVIGKDTDRGKLYLENCRGDVEIATSDDVEAWPWELKQKGGMNNEKEPSRYRSASLPVRQNQRRKIPRSLCNCTPQGTHSPLLRRVPYQTACPMGATSYLHDKESYTPAGI